MSGYPYTTPAPMPRALMAARADERRRPGLAGPLWLAGLSLLALAVVWVVAELVPATHLRDAVLLHRFVALQETSVNGVAEVLPHLLNPPLFTIWGAVLVLVAIARQRPRVALAVALVLALAPLSSEILKPLLAHPHVRIGYTHIGPPSFPSGHSTAAAILALSAVLVVPRRARFAVGALAAAFALAVGAALLIRAWHMPSDVLGGYLIALAWTALAVAGVRWSERRWPRRRPAQE
ncbi:MAG TPA: phosphatase PAP2 family protein [Solirubrobacteraceae bacterium]|jgi:membrane-associated phospholipid phosphatase|nr:phosphatase PAP2 family protein [Solirubrobacteraceae bacterium]